jgi:spermidine synthase
MGWYFAFFFISGLCSILYELVWLRLAMAQFGVTTALVSLVLSMFMLGLGGGSWAAGYLIRRYGKRNSLPPLGLYAFAELLIGCSSLAVPAQFLSGHRLLVTMANRVAMESLTYYIVSGAFVALTVIPWCALMGATIPLGMSAIRNDPRFENRRSFSFLYLSNVVGAVSGAIAPLFLIELYGFHGALRVGACLNAAIAISAFGLTRLRRMPAVAGAPAAVRPTTAASGRGKSALLLLFLTGFATMGMEVLWIRLFTPYVGPVVYSFALILACYLIATFVGSFIYRDISRSHDPDDRLAWVILALLGILPLLTSDPRLHLHAVLRVFLGVAPFAGVIGFLTPMLVDRWSAGDPDRAGRAYAVNILGCILGPLLSGFALLPFVGEHLSMLLFVLPWLAMGIIRPFSRKLSGGKLIAAYVAVAMAVAVFFLTKDFETLFPSREVLRDNTATVIATGTGMRKQLITNGVGITQLTPITKMMAHMALASLEQPPRNVLVICFGMGTTYRSVISWGIAATAVDLVPSVPKLFSYYHSDGAKVLASPLSHLVIDDGRRYLERSLQNYDAIIVDPPPPVPAAGSSLLYSKEFYSVVKKRLQSSGIFQQWLPNGDSAVQASVARALQDSFPYVRVYRSVEGSGYHFLASMRPIPARDASGLLARMPTRAVVDMMEWGPADTPSGQFERMLSTEMTTYQMVRLSPETPPLQDDRPINEYFLIRQMAQ